MGKNTETEMERRKVLRLNNAESNRLTRECLVTALLKLMKEKPFDSITISELVRRAGVSRTAFYRNYTTKEDVIGEIRKTLLETANDFLRKPELYNDQFKWYRECFSFVKENAELINPVLEANMTLRDFFKDQSVLETLGATEDRFERYKNLAVEAAFLKILTIWYTDGMIESPDEMAEFCTNGFEELI